MISTNAETRAGITTQPVTLTLKSNRLLESKEESQVPWWYINPNTIVITIHSQDGIREISQREWLEHLEAQDEVTPSPFCKL